MGNHAGRDEVARRKIKLEAVFAQMVGAELTPELISHYSRYLCVLVSGHAEQSVKELVTQYVRLRSEQRVQRYVGKQLDRLRNINVEKLRQLIESFDNQWWRDLEQKFPDELEAFDSVATIRNSIAHGGDTGITPVTVRQYFDQVSTVLDALCALLDSR